jgi:hypothetical protein
MTKANHRVNVVRSFGDTWALPDESRFVTLTHGRNVVDSQPV